MNYTNLTIIDGPVDLELLNKACIIFGTNQGNQEELDKIDKVLTKFTERPDSFNYCFPVINGNFHTFTKFFAYKIVRKNIINRWYIFADDEKEEIRHSILISIVQMIKEGQKQFTISMANQTLVEILKNDWPEKWPTFLEELLLTCQTEGIQFLKNALNILQMIAEEIPSSNSSAGTTNMPYYITRDRQRSIKGALIKELPTIYTIVENAFNLNQNSDELSIADINDINNKSLKALECLIPVVGTERLLETPLVSGIAPLLMSDEFTFKVFSVFGKFCENLAQSDSDNSCAKALETSLLSVFQESIKKIYTIYGDEINFNCVEKEDIFQLVNSVYNFFNLFIPIMNPAEYQEEISMAINWIIQIATSGYVDNSDEDDSDDLLFSEVIKFWHFFAVMLYRSASQEEASQFHEIYSDSISQIIPFLVKNIVCPYSFVDVSSEYGNHVQKSISLNSYESNLYDTMKEIFVVLFGLKKEELVEAISAEITSLQSDDFDSNTINSISWVLGSLSKAISDDENFNLMSEIIPVFLSLIENENPTNDPTIEEFKLTASKALLFLCSQEAKYFRSNPEFLSSLIQIVFQFFISDESTLNIIAIHTFTLLSKSCKQAFITPIPPSNRMILDDILENFLDLIDQMKPEHRCSFTAAAADIVRVLESTNEVHQMQFDQFVECISTIFNQPVSQIDDILSQFQYMSQATGAAIERFPNLDALSISFDYEFQQPILADAEVLRAIIDAVSILSVLPSSMHSYFLYLFDSLLPKLVSLYEYVTNNSTSINTTNFDEVTDQAFTKMASSTCEYYIEIANLISVLFANVLKILKQDQPQFLTSIISSFILGSNFHALAPPSYPPKIFLMYSNLFHFTLNFDINDMQLQDAVTKMFFEIFDYIFTPASEAIKDEYDELYDLRIGVLSFMRGVIRGRPDFILNLNEEQIELFVQCLIWFTGHPYEEISGNAVETCFILINTFKTSTKITYKALVDTFWSKYFIVFASQMFTLLSDSTYKFGFDGQTLVLANLFQFELNQELINTIIANANEVFERSDCEALINQLIPTSTSLLEFRAIMKDFLVQVKEYSSTDPELCQIEIFKQKRKESLAGRVPGLEKSELTTSGNIEEDMDSMDAIFKNLSL